MNKVHKKLELIVREFDKIDVIVYNSIHKVGVC